MNRSKNLHSDSRMVFRCLIFNMDGVIHGIRRKSEGSKRGKRNFTRATARNNKNSKRYLQAIEQGNFQTLPGTFYARAFIKEFANAVGLDADLLLEEHKGEIPVPEEDTTTPQYRRIQRSRKDASPAKTSPRSEERRVGKESRSRRAT